MTLKKQKTHSKTSERKTLEIEVISQKSQSSREHNDDNFYFNVPRQIFAVFDGVSQGGEGYKASAIAMASFEASFEDNVESANLLEDLLAKANSDIIAHTKGHTTAIAGRIDADGNLNMANVGDSAVYLIRNYKLFKLSKDQTQGEMLKSQGNPDWPRYSNVITNYLGKNKNLKDVDTKIYFGNETLDKLLLQKDDLLLFATDGITCRTNENTIKNLAVNYSKLDELLENVVAENYKNTGEKVYVDDITVIAVRYNGKPGDSHKNNEVIHKVIDRPAKSEKHAKPEHDPSILEESVEAEYNPPPVGESAVWDVSAMFGGNVKGQQYQQGQQTTAGSEEHDSDEQKNTDYRTEGITTEKEDDLASSKQNKSLETEVLKNSLRTADAEKNHTNTLNETKSRYFDIYPLGKEARKLIDEDRFTEAELHYKTLMNMYPDREGIFVDASYASLRTGKCWESIELANQAISILRKNGDKGEDARKNFYAALINQAFAYEKLAETSNSGNNEMLTEALALYSSALLHYPKDENFTEHTRNELEDKIQIIQSRIGV